MFASMRLAAVMGPLLGAVLCVAQTGCSSKVEIKGGGGAENTKVTSENLGKIKEGMAQKEVTDLLGPATEVKDAQGGTKEHVWKSGNNSITVGMKDGKVEYKMGQIVSIKLN